VCPTVREPDGLAMSSRNVRLGADDRLRALALKRGLDAAAEAVRAGARDAAAVERTGREEMRRAGVDPEYFAVVAAATLAPFDDGAPLAGELLMLVAARVGPVRLIDNVLLQVGG
jgi:pantoate--beta-alanine ligase